MLKIIFFSDAGFDRLAHLFPEKNIVLIGNNDKIEVDSIHPNFPMESEYSNWVGVGQET